MRRLLLLCLLLPACGDSVPPADEGISCESGPREVEDMHRPEADVVFVISDSAAMDGYRGVLNENLRVLAEVLLDEAYAGIVNLHISVVGPDGFVSGCVDGEYLIDLSHPWFTCVDDPEACRERNYDGPMVDALTCLSDIPADGAATPPLLERLDDALSDAGDFLRPEALLLVVLVSPEDDASPDTTAEYAQRLLVHETLATRVTVVTGSSSPRLEAFLDLFDTRPESLVSIEDLDWTYAFEPLYFKHDLAGRCLVEGTVLTDVDVDEPGLQLDCIVEDVDGSLIPPCTMAGGELPAADTALPCYWVSSESFDELCAATPYVERAHYQSRHAIARCACEP